jgi:hypothetical protein
MNFQSICTDHPYSIAVLLPTRGRTKLLEKSIRSLVDHADNVQKLQFLLAFDDDDTQSYDFFHQKILPWCVESKIAIDSYQTQRLGYAKLHEYYNFLAEESVSDWLLLWNDDSVMESDHWDSEIVSYTGQFKLLAFRSNHDHPYAIFPVIPKDWYHVCGHLSLHGQTDAWISQVGYALDLYQPIQSYVSHNRADIVEEAEEDNTFLEREYLEGNLADSKDFNNINQHLLRCKDADRIAWFLKNKGQDISRWYNIMQGKVFMFDKLRQNDTKGYTQTIIFKTDETH